MLNPIRELLLYKGRKVYSISGHASVSEAVRLMNQARIGSLVVMEQGRLSGVFTERDVLLKIVDAGLDPVSTRVDAVMTRDPHTISVEDSVQDAMKLITDTRCRHLPVLEQGCLAGLISIGDLMRWMVYDRDHQIDELTHYITDTGLVDRDYAG